MFQGWARKITGQEHLPVAEWQESKNRLASGSTLGKREMPGNNWWEV